MFIKSKSCSIVTSLHGLVVSALASPEVLGSITRHNCFGLVQTADHVDIDSNSNNILLETCRKISIKIMIIVFSNLGLMLRQNTNIKIFFIFLFIQSSIVV